MHLFGGNGKNGRHSASGRGSNDERNYDRYEEYEDDYGGYDEPEYESRGYDSFDDGEYDFDYDRRYRARQQRYASRSAARDGREQRFASDESPGRRGSAGAGAGPGAWP